MQITKGELENLLERYAVATSALVGSKIAEEIAKKLDDEKHSNPVTPHCEKILGEVPLCWDFRGVRAWVLCRAWQIMEKERRAKLPVGEAWAEARRICAMAEAEKPAKASELCALSHMEQIPACKK